jgi:hypothetical protein
MKEHRKIKIDDLEKKQVFTVPERYFEQLPQQISRKAGQSQKRRSPFEWPVLRYGAAMGGVCLFILLGYFLIKPTATDAAQPEAILSQVSRQEIVQYLQQTEVSQYELVERASEANLVIEEKALDEVEVNQELLWEETDSELIEELI